MFTDMVKVDPLDIAAWLVATAIFAVVLTALVIALVDRVPVRRFGLVMPNTYDITTPIGQARLHAADTDITNAIFTDAEYSYFLTVTSQDPISAAAFALESLAADASRMAYAIKSQGLDVDRKTFAEQLRAQALSLRSQAGVGGSVDAPDRVFSTDDANDDTIGTMSNW